MHFLLVTLIWFLSLRTTGAATCSSQSTDGIYSLIKRRLPHHADSFRLSLVDNSESCSQTFSVAEKPNDSYTVSTTHDGKILVEGNSVGALASGLHRYLSDVVHVDIYWFIGSRLHLAPRKLPQLEHPIKGSSVVPWRYDFNTVTFSYTTPFWTWEEWETELDWMALRGINLPLAWVGYEKLLFDLFQDIGLHETEILDFFSGPAFQAWNRFGNVQDSWGGQRLPLDWIEGQFELQKKIVARMVELGMTPVLPAFTGFVPREFDRVFPNASTVTAPQWSNFPIKYTNVTFLEPTDYRFAQLQQSFIAKQQAAYGNITHVYTLDQYNGMNPSGDPSDLRHLARSTINSLKKADPSAVWMMQGWIFYIDPDFWTEQRIQAFLSGVSTNTDMLILDFYSESHPLWRSTDSYYGKPWIWCMLHAFGGNMELYGQVMNLTIDPVEALAASPSLVGFGLTPDAQEGNEVVYDLLLKQAWSDIPIDVEGYFRDWVSTRYADPGHHSGSEVPHPLYHAWSIIASTVYNNTNSTYAQSSEASILTKEPSLDLSTYVPFDLIRTSIDYDPSALIRAWTSFISAASSKPSLWINPAFLHDLVDLTRQILANEFLFVYTDLISIYTSSSASASASKRGKEISGKCDKMLTLLYALDAVLETNPAFRLDTWVESARRSADAKTRTKSMAEYFAFSARNQVTLFGPNGEILDSACKEWSGLVRGYYAPRWKIFTDYIKSTPAEGYNATVVHGKMTEFETEWMAGGRGREDRAGHGAGGDLKGVLGRVRREFGDVFR